MYLLSQKLLYFPEPKRYSYYTRIFSQIFLNAKLPKPVRAFSGVESSLVKSLAYLRELLIL